MVAPIDNAGTPTIVANQTVTLTDNATNYVKRTAAGVASFVTDIDPGGWPATLWRGRALYHRHFWRSLYQHHRMARRCWQCFAAVTFTGGTLLAR